MSLLDVVNIFWHEKYQTTNIRPYAIRHAICVKGDEKKKGSTTEVIKILHLFISGLEYPADSTQWSPARLFWIQREKDHYILATAR